MHFQGGEYVRGPGIHVCAGDVGVMVRACTAGGGGDGACIHRGDGVIVHVCTGEVMIDCTRVHREVRNESALLKEVAWGMTACVCWEGDSVVWVCVHREGDV